MPDPITAIAGSAIVGVGASVMGANAQEDAAESAANASTQNTDKSIALQREMWQKNLELQKPYYGLGVNALNQGFGKLNSEYTALSDQLTDTNKNISEIQNKLSTEKDPATISNLKESLSQYQTKQSELTNKINSTPEYNMDMNKLNSYSPSESFKNESFAGRKDFTYDPLKTQTINTRYTTAPTQRNDFSFNANDLNTDPSYQFRLQQGVNALDKSASSRGMLLSGAQQKAVDEYGQNLASQEYANAYNRALQTQQQNVGQDQTYNALAIANSQNNFGQDLNVGQFNMAQQNQQYNQSLGAYQTNFNKDLQTYQTNSANALNEWNSQMALGSQKYNQLANLSGLGQTSAGQIGNAGTNMANASSNALMQNASNLGSAYSYAGNAQAGMYSGLANAGSNALNQYMMASAFKLI